MKNETEIVEELVKRGYSKLRRRKSWIKDSWTVRFDENDIEIFDSPDKTGKYLIANVRTVNLGAILDDVEEQIKK